MPGADGHLEALLIGRDEVQRIAAGCLTTLPSVTTSVGLAPKPEARTKLRAGRPMKL
jgi:hypothetical protein